MMDFIQLARSLQKIEALVWRALAAAGRALAPSNSFYQTNTASVPTPVATLSLTSPSFKAKQTGKIRVQHDFAVVSTNGGAPAPNVLCNVSIIRDIAGTPVTLATASINTGANGTTDAASNSIEVQDQVTVGSSHTYSVVIAAQGAGNVITYTGVTAVHQNLYEMP